MPYTKEQLAEEIEKRQAEARKQAEARAARHAKMTEHNKEMSESDRGRAQTRAWFNAVRTGNTQELRRIDSEVAREYADIDVEVRRMGYRADSQNVTTQADGGYLVPTVIEKAIVEKMVDVAPIRQFATVISNAPANLRVPGQVSRPQVAWTAEEANYNKTKATFSGFDIVAKKLTGIVPLTEEFQQDAAAFSVVEQLLTKQLAEEIAYQENIAFLAGDGTSKPRGIRTRKNALPANQKINFGANVAALNYDAVKKAYRAMPISYRRNAFWVGNTNLVTQLDTVKDTTGRYIYTQDVRDGLPYDKLLGLPFVEVDTTAMNFDELWLVNKNCFWITDVAGVRIDFGYANGDFESGRNSLRVMKRTGASPLITDGFVMASVNGA